MPKGLWRREFRVCPAERRGGLRGQGGAGAGSKGNGGCTMQLRYPAGLAIQASLSASPYFPAATCPRPPKQRLALLVSGGCRMATQGIPDRNLLAFLSNRPSTVVLIARALTQHCSLWCVVFCVVVDSMQPPEHPEGDTFLTGAACGSNCSLESLRENTGLGLGE